MLGQWSLTLMHHTRGLFFFQDPDPSNRNAAPLAHTENAAKKPATASFSEGIV